MEVVGVEQVSDVKGKKEDFDDRVSSALGLGEANETEGNELLENHAIGEVQLPSKQFTLPTITDEQRKIISNNIAKRLLTLGVNFNFNNLQLTRANGHDVFGVSLQYMPMEEVEDKSLVPVLLVYLIKLLKPYLDTFMLFRKSGSARTQNDMRDHLQKGGLVEQLWEPATNAINLSCVLKSFFRLLPERLITPNLHASFVDVFALDLPLHEREDLLLGMCLSLPQCSINVLRFALKFFWEVTMLSDKNTMTVSNMVLMLTPNMTVSMGKSIDDHGKAQLALEQGFIEVLLRNYERIGLVEQWMMQEVLEDPKPPEFKSTKSKFIQKIRKLSMTGAVYVVEGVKEVTRRFSASKAEQSTFFVGLDGSVPDTNMVMESVVAKKERKSSIRQRVNSQPHPRNYGPSTASPPKSLHEIYSKQRPSSGQVETPRSFLERQLSFDDLSPDVFVSPPWYSSCQEPQYWFDQSQDKFRESLSMVLDYCPDNNDVFG